MTGRIPHPNIVSAHDSPTYHVGGHLVTFIAGAAETNGVYSLFEIHTAPGQGARLYCQHYEDETFWVLDGVYTFVLGQQERALAAGSYIYIPRRTPHAYRNSGPGVARMLVLVTPGGIRERFFAEAGELTVHQDASTLPGALPDFSRLLGIARKYGIEVLPVDTPPEPAH